LRERIRVENGKAIIVFTSALVADKLLQNSKNLKLGKYDLILRPFAKDSYTAFLGGLRVGTTPEIIEATFKHYQPILSSSILRTNNPNKPHLINGTITFGSK
jgi:hypothetical protein